MEKIIWHGIELIKQSKIISEDLFLCGDLYVGKDNDLGIEIEYKSGLNSSVTVFSDFLHVSFSGLSREEVFEKLDVFLVKKVRRYKWFFDKFEEKKDNGTK